MQETGANNDAGTRGAWLRVGALIGACFLLGSTGWLAWLYRLAPLADPAQVDFLTMVAGYIAQAAGIGAYMLARQKMADGAADATTIAALIVYVILLEPAATADGLAPLLAAGYAMNVACGWFQGHYLCCLARIVPRSRRGTAFGVGYAASTLATWLLSGVAGGALAQGLPCLAVCGVLALLCILCVRLTAALTPADATETAEDHSAATEDAGSDAAESGRSNDRLGSTSPDGSSARALLLLAGAAVIVVSLVKNAGFSFPTADLSGTVDLELSRLFYGIGLLAAGIVADHDRRIALALCAISLVTPFLMLALAGAHASSVVLWALGYLLFGFFAVWRAVLFADLAESSHRVWLAGAGLALGRVGDVLGTALCLALADATIALVAASGDLFIAATALLALLYRRLHLPAANTPEQFELRARELKAEFVARHALSQRECEVLELLLDGKTNAEIAGALFITESTVKFHVRNILKKSGLSNRLEIIEACTRRIHRPS